MNHYHNTSEVSGQVLDKYERKAKTQDELIMAFIKLGVRINWTPSEIEAHVRYMYDKHWPITSIRRALSNLTKRGLLQKLNTQRNGPHNRPEHCWSLPSG